MSHTMTRLGADAAPRRREVSATGQTAVRAAVDGQFFVRGRHRLRIRGVTYGPFAPGPDGQPFPTRPRAASDLQQMRAAGINAFRTYHVPPGWLLGLADEQGLNVFVDVPWRKHLCFLDSAAARLEARQAVARAAAHGRDHPCVFAYSVGNEIPPEVVRWHGARRVERFLAALADVARQADPTGLVFTGGHRIDDWRFGITHADRSPKGTYYALREVFAARNASLLPRAPRVSVVVCTYNGGRTLDQCLRSLGALDYPDYEVIVVDDGSTDNTGDILARHPDVRVLRQPNRGLSAARNAGLAAATGAVIAYTDSDCFADPDWLTHLVYQLEHSGAAAVGGPNLTPDDGWLAACVAAAPGQPTHVLESDQVAEHVPGCNMAFRREALLAINGFDPQYRRAGDDVDVCWRLHQAGKWITFAPGAFVWHHRRQGPRAYLKQQAGYGEAEALLCFQHPARFNSRGDGKWRGTLYGAALQGLRLSTAIIYHGTFGTALFQCLYQPGPAHWAMLPATLEWHFAAAVIALAANAWPAALPLAAIMVGLSLLVAVLQAAQARLAPSHDGLSSRLVVAALCYAQPLVRSWARYRTRLFNGRKPMEEVLPDGASARRFPAAGRLDAAYWGERGQDRTELLGAIVADLRARRWGTVIDTGWSDWDLRIDCDRWNMVEVSTTQENHGGNRRLIRARFRLRPRDSAGLIVMVAGLAVAGAACVHAAAGAAALAILLPVGLLEWWRGLGRASQVARVFDAVARRLELFRCETGPGRNDGAGPVGLRDAPAGEPTIS
jgi:GT2 family glycosyltransferase